MLRLMVVIGIAATLGCSGVSEEQYKTSQAEAAKTKQALQAESGKAAALETKVQSLQQQNDALLAQVGELEKRLASTAAAKSDLEVTSAKMIEQTKELQGKMNIKLSDQLLFKENSSQLTAEAKRTLDSIAEAIKQVPDKDVIVVGYTDDKEASGQNGAAKGWQLSTARALTVAKYLAGREVDPAKVATAGFGASRPVAPNDSLANRSLNRRVEIALAPVNVQLGTVDIRPATLKTK